MKFTAICRKTAEELKRYVVLRLRKAGYNPVVGNGYVYAKGNNVDVLLTAHLDTVHVEPVEEIFYWEDGCLSSPQGIGGDDRCGVYMILDILRKTDLRPSILFCEDEETGCIGAQKFIKTQYAKEMQALKFMIELDRANANDIVFYGCDNKDFTEWVKKVTGYIVAHGSMSDISYLAPDAGVAAVNISCGYYNQHTLSEYVVPEEMNRSIQTTIKLLQEAQSESIGQFEYVEQKYYSYWRDIDPGVLLEIEYLCEDGEGYATAGGASVSEAFGHFFKEHPTVCFNDILDFYRIY